MNVHIIDMKDFSVTPFGRYTKDGAGNGTAFRESFLYEPMVDPSIDRVVVKLDSVVPGYEYGSSFLDEAFGGLIRVHHLDSKLVLKKLEVQTNYPDYKLEIQSYIEEADA